MNRATTNDVARLEQAASVRDDALRLLRDRFRADVEAATELALCDQATMLALRADADKLIVEYLAESEKLFSPIP